MTTKEEPKGPDGVFDIVKVVHLGGNKYRMVMRSDRFGEKTSEFVAVSGEFLSELQKEHEAVLDQTVHP